jgi:Concanavalin A-like lectin/glucanases superfamily
MKNKRVKTNVLDVQSIVFNDGTKLEADNIRFQTGQVISSADGFSPLNFFVSQPDPNTVLYALNATTIPLTVSVTYDRLTTYQWFENILPSTNPSIPVPIVGATSPSFSPPSTSVGVKYYYCVATYQNQILTSNVSGAIVIQTTGTYPFGPNHVYRFTINGNTTGTVIPDLVGSLNGSFVQRQAIPPFLSGITNGVLTSIGGSNTTYSYATLPRGLLHDGLSASIEVWVNRQLPVTSSPFQFIFNFGPTGTSNRLYGSARSETHSNLITSEFSSNAFPVSFGITAQFWPADTLYHHGVYVFDDLKKQMRSYFDGQLKTVTQLLQTATLATYTGLTENNLIFGSPFPADQGTKAQIKHLAIYPYALTDANILTLYQNGEPPPP